MIQISDPALAQEFTKRAVGKLASLVRQLAPTYENSEGKKEHREIPIIGSRIVFGTDVADFALDLQLRPEELALRHKKTTRNRLREILETGQVSGLFKYEQISNWIKTNDKNVEAAFCTDAGLVLRVVGGFAEFKATIGPEHYRYVADVLERIQAHTPEGSEVCDELPFELDDEHEGSIVIAVLDNELVVTDALFGDQGIAQAKIKAETLAKGDTRTLRVFTSPLGGHVLRVTTECPLYTSRQYFRALDVTSA